jgi:DNA-directed RNA polymerase specialized sigma24 family protein
VGEQTAGTGAHRAVAGGRRREAARGRPRRDPPAPYQPYLDGLFTYCLSVLGEHDAATGALAETLALAEHHHARLRDHRMLRAWLYALARHCCRRRLATGGEPAAPAVSAGVARSRRADLAALAWPEAEGTAPDQREALELAVRHGLAPHELAAVLGLEPARARALLGRAASEVERGRAALATVDVSDCPDLGGLAGDPRALGPDLRRALVRHVEGCPRCRSVADLEPALGLDAEPREVLPLVPAPRASLLRREPAHPLGPRFDRGGFPVELAGRAARRSSLLRHRAVTTTVVAAVVAAPVLALWAAYRGGHHEAAAPGAGVSAGADGRGPRHGAAYEDDTGGTGLSGGVPGVAAAHRPAEKYASRPHAHDSRGSRAPSAAPTRPGEGPARNQPPAPGRLDLSARPQGRDTVVTLANSGGTPVRWRATPQVEWLLVDRASGELAPGESTTVVISVDGAQQPSGVWSGRVLFTPTGAVTVEGTGPTPEPTPTPTPPSTPG